MVKIKAENRSFLDRWEAEYLFTYVKDRPVCLLCGANVTITQEYNIRRHYEMKNQDKDLDMTQIRQKVGHEKRFGCTTDYVQKSHITKRGCCKC